MAQAPTPAALISTAIRENNIDALKSLSSEHKDICAGKSALGPLLCVAALKAEPQTIQFLLELGLDPNLGHPPFGENALAVAARKGRLEVVKILRDAGAKLDTSEPTRNPLVAVASSNSETACKP